MMSVSSQKLTKEDKRQKKKEKKKRSEHIRYSERIFTLFTFTFDEYKNINLCLTFEKKHIIKKNNFLIFNFIIKFTKKIKHEGER